MPRRRRTRSGQSITITFGRPGPKSGRGMRRRRSSGNSAVNALVRELRRGSRPAPQGLAGSPEHVFYDGFGRPRRFGR